MKIYWSEKHIKEPLPRSLYIRIIWQIRDYARMKERMEEVVCSTPSEFMQASDKSFSDPTGTKAVMVAAISNEINAIEKALGMIPAEYHKGIVDNICLGRPYPAYACISTWKRWKHRLVNQIVRNMGYI